ncbi:hypothetical protein LBMAG42_53600 [Deltaproteobacteria bacterium]|nr:hypothetical protein LBMAG42_53600 [Deltaproteobacteria bacterium]
MLNAGQIVGSYRIVAAIGEGGFATVYRAEHEVLGSVHAIKVLNAEMSTKEDVTRRFLDEARVQARLRHPNIVRVTDIIALPTVAAIVMDYVEGESLATWIAARRAPPSPAEIRELILPLLDALGYVHRNQVIHRDVKPDNVIVTRGTRDELVPLMLDFGIARVRGELGARASKKSTGFGSKMGTQGYMSPEHIRSANDVDARTDIFALGVVALELATLRHPFERGSEYDTMHAVVTADYSIPAVLEARDPALVAAIRVALRVKPADRFPDAAGFAAAIRGGTGVRSVQKGMPAEPAGEPSRVASAPPPVAAVDERIVDNFSGLAAAIADRRPGQSLRLRAGTYHLREPLEVTGSLNLIGEGADHTRIRCDVGRRVLGFAGGVMLTVVGVAFERVGTAEGDVVDVAGGRASFSACRFSGASMAGLRVRCGASAIVERCQMTKNLFGVEVVDTAFASLSSNECRENNSCGISFSGDAGGTATGNTCDGNALHGIHVAERAHPTLEANECRQNKSCGIAFFGDAGGTAKANKCQGNAANGIYVDGRAQPTLDANECRENKSAGIAFFGDTGGTASGNECHGNAADGIYVGARAKPTLDANECWQNKRCGIGFQDDAGGWANGNKCRCNAADGIYVGARAQPTLYANECSQNISCGIAFCDEAAGTAKANQCTANGFHGLYIEERAHPLLDNNQCTGNRGQDTVLPAPPPASSIWSSIFGSKR